MGKYIFDAQKTDNISKIKKDDIKLLIHNLKTVLDTLYYDNEIVDEFYREYDSFSIEIEMKHIKRNPVEYIYTLIESAEFALSNCGNWDNTLDIDDAKELYDALYDLEHSLSSAISYAKDHSKFKDEYTAYWNDYNKNIEESKFSKAKEKLDDQIKKEAGWSPTYNADNGKFEYSYFTDYLDYRVSLKNVERDDGKQTLSPEVVQKKIDRGY
ncbi:MAG: hypothetical protein ACI4N3_04005 [Alphaproteobacteria bacterium]